MVILIFLKTVSFDIVFTSGITGQFVKGSALFLNRDFPPVTGGFKILKKIVEEKKSMRKVILVDGGNTTGGYITGESINIKYALSMLKSLKYDVFVPGKREFFKKDVLEEFSHSKLNIISSNIYKDSLHRYSFIKPYIIKNIDGIRIGIVGFTSPLLPLETRKINLNNIYVKDIDNLYKWVEELKKKTDIVIVCSNAGFDIEKQIAQKIQGIDIILGGGSGPGLRLPYEDPISHTLIFRNYNYLTSINIITLTFKYNILIKWEVSTPILFDYLY